MGTTYYAVNVARREAIDLNKGSWCAWDDSEAQHLDLAARLQYVWGGRLDQDYLEKLVALLGPHEPFLVLHDDAAHERYEGFKIIIDRFGDVPSTLNDGHLL